MSYLLRTPLIIRRKEPYVAWANSHDSEVLMTPELASIPDVYVVRLRETTETDDLLLEEYWREIFEFELSEWESDENRWPADRTREMFDAWFDVAIGESIIDLDPMEPLSQDELDAADVDEAMSVCAWCGTDLDDGGREVWFMLQDRGLLEGDVSRVLPVLAEDNRLLLGVIPAADEPRPPAEDIVFYACNRQCMQALKKHVPPALRRHVRE
jgi:hypothetical protein